MPLNSDALQDTQIELNRMRQEVVQLRHTNRTFEAEAKRLRDENARLQKENSELQNRVSRPRASYE